MFPDGFISRLKLQAHILYLLKWLAITLLLGSVIGSASAILLLGLEWAAETRGQFPFLLFFLPIGGLVVGLLYHYLGKDVVKGNNQLIEEVENPQKVVSIRMAPLVLIGTIITHVFGGSAGREGTAVQMGGSIADQLTKFFSFNKDDRRIILICGISAGFASVFGTPLAGAIFAIEVIAIGKMKTDALLPSLLAALAANFFCDLWPIHHTHYQIISSEIPKVDFNTIIWSVGVGVVFGWAAMAFSFGMHWVSDFYKKYIKKHLLIPVLGGVVVVLLAYLMGAKYWGLGVPHIVEAFEEQQEWYVFLFKIILTTLTIGAGFKGGEVTPLFFVGATLGSALSMVVPMHVSLLAGMGFVAVFAGATNAPIACIVMGIELFGSESLIYVAIAVLTAYFFSGHTGIYQSQKVARAKHPLYKKHYLKHLRDL